MKNNEFKKVPIKNCTCYYFDEITKLEDFDFNNILTVKKSHEKTLIYDISYKTLIGPKPFRIRLDKIDGFIIIYDGTRYLTLFGSEKCGLKSGITYIFSHCFPKIKVDSYYSLPIEKILTLHDVTIHIKSVLHKDKNHYYYKIFLEKCSYQLAKENRKKFFSSIIMVKF